MRDDGVARRVGRIVDVEAYGGPEDRASHARFGPGSRAATMFGAPGRAYVYGIYGMHLCLNVVVGSAGQGAAVLLRAVEPLEGIARMRVDRLARAVASRRAAAANPAAEAARIARLPVDRLASGPANLAAAFGVARTDDGLDLLAPGGRLRVEPGPGDRGLLRAEATVRVGVAYAGPGWADRPWRFTAVRTSSPPGPAA